MDDVPTGQPALALAQKVIDACRTRRAARRSDPRRDHHRDGVGAESDAENALRTAVLEFMDTVRAAEQAVSGRPRRRRRSVTRRPSRISAEEWRAHWPG